MMFRHGLKRAPVASYKKRYVNLGEGDVPIWYVFVDESGVPYYRDRDPVFYMGAVVTDDPELLASKILSHPSETAEARRRGRKKVESGGAEPGTSEIKYSSTDDEIHSAILDDLEKIEARSYSVEIKKSESDSQANGREMYMDAFRQLIRLIAQTDESGLYRICVDYSTNFDEGRMRGIAKEELGPGQHLDSYIGVMPADSILVPGIQAADVFVGTRRSDLLKNRPANTKSVRGRKHTKHQKKKCRGGK